MGRLARVLPHCSARPMKKGNSRLTDDQRAELAALEALPDDAINTTDIPELLDWSDARRGAFYRPVKQQDHPALGRRCRHVVQDARTRRPWLSDGHQPRAARARAADGSAVTL